MESTRVYYIETLAQHTTALRAADAALVACSENPEELQDTLPDTGRLRPRTDRLSARTRFQDSSQNRPMTASRTGSTHGRLRVDSGSTQAQDKSSPDQVQNTAGM